MAVIRGDEVLLSDSKDLLEAGDQLVVICMPEVMGGSQQETRLAQLIRTNKIRRLVGRTLYLEINILHYNRLYSMYMRS